MIEMPFSAMRALPVHWSMIRADYLIRYSSCLRQPFPDLATILDQAVAILLSVRSLLKRLRRAAGVIAIPRVLCFGDGRLWYEQGGGLVRAETFKDAGTVGTKTITAHRAGTCHNPNHEPSSQRCSARDTATVQLLLSHSNLQDPGHDNDKPMGQYYPILVLNNPDCSENGVQR